MHTKVKGTIAGYQPHRALKEKCIEGTDNSSFTVDVKYISYTAEGLPSTAEDLQNIAHTKPFCMSMPPQQTEKYRAQSASLGEHLAKQFSNNIVLLLAAVQNKKNVAMKHMSLPE